MPAPSQSTIENQLSEMPRDVWLTKPMLSEVPTEECLIELLIDPPIDVGESGVGLMGRLLE